MKRPLALVGFSYLLALLAVVSLRITSLFPAVLCLSAYAGTLLVRKRERVRILSLCFLTCSLAFGTFHMYTSSVAETVQSYAGKTVPLGGFVWETPEYENGRYRYVLQVPENLLGRHVSFRVRMYTQEKLADRTGDFLSGNAALYLPEDSGGLDGYASQMADGIFLYGYFQEEEKVLYRPRESTSLHDWFMDLRVECGKRISQFFGSDSGLIHALLLGDKQSLSEQVSEDFRTAGVSHLLAVSGFHMAVLIQLLHLFLGKVIPFRRIRSVCTMAVLICFMGISGFTPSVCRSGIMCLLLLSGDLFVRHADSLNSLGLAALVLVWQNPWAAADVGLLLSISACLGLLLLEKPLEQAISRKMIPASIRLRLAGRVLHGIYSGIAASLSAVLFTLPVSLLIFGTVSLAGPLANFFLLYPISLLLYLAVLALLFSVLPGGFFLASPLGWAVHLLCLYGYRITGFLASLPYASISFAGREAVLWMACCFVLIGVTVWILKSRRLFRVTALLALILYLSTVLSGQIAERNVVKLLTADSGDGISCVFICNGKAALLGCRGYSEQPVKRLLQEEGISCLSAGLLLSGEYDEAGNAGALLEDFPMELLFIPGKESSNGKLLKNLSKTEKPLFFENSCGAQWMESLQVEAAGGFTRVQCRETRLLFWPAKAKREQLPSGWEVCDIVFLERPEDGMDAVEAAVGILCADERTQIQDADRWKTASFPLVGTDGGTIELCFMEDRTIQLRRK